MCIDEITVNGYLLPVKKLTENGFKRTKNKLWSSNSGRTVSGKMVGDVKATKYTLQFEFDELTAEEVSKIETAIGTSAFFPVTFPKEGTGNPLTKTFYAADPTYNTKRSVDGEEIFSDFTLELIEQ